MDKLLIWGIVLLAVALVLLFIEVFVPSGGLIAILAASCAVGGLVMLFMNNTTTGLIGAIVVAVALPFLIGFMVKLAPNTPVIRFLTLSTSQQAVMQRHTDEETASRDQADNPHAGDTGDALTDLRPVGTCLINGKRIECLADGGMIQTGSKIRVVAVDGMTIKVRRAEA